MLFVSVHIFNLLQCLLIELLLLPSVFHFLRKHLLFEGNKLALLILQSQILVAESLSLL